MRFTAFVIALLFSLTSQAALKSPKTIVFETKNGDPAETPLVVTFDGALPLAEEPDPTPTAEDATHSCEIKYWNSQDNVLRVNNHRFMETDVTVTIEGKKHFITPAFGAGRSNPWESKWSFCTTIVYANTAECFAKKNPIRIQIGAYHSEKKVYTNAADYKISWESGTDFAYLFDERKHSDDNWQGKVTEWY